MLLESVVAKSNFELSFASGGPSESSQHREQGGDWVVDEYAAVTSPREAAADGLIGATRTCSVVSAFLLGAVAVPRDVLSKVSPVLLIRLFQHLGSGLLPSQPSAEVNLFGTIANSLLILPWTLLTGSGRSSQQIYDRCSYACDQAFCCTPSQLCV